MVITLPFDTPTANVIRFILIEYFILKLFSFATESCAKLSACRRAQVGQTVSFREGWAAFFLVPYRIQERTFARRWLPWFLVVILNAFLLSIEFGFQSATLQDIPVLESEQQISTAQLGPSTVLEGVSDVNWISRTERLANSCLNRQKGLEVYAAEGFLRDASLDDDLENLESVEVVCADDSRLHYDLNKVMFKISHSGLLEVKEPFRYAKLQLLVNRVTDNLFSFDGGDIDLEVEGTLDLSLDAPQNKDYVFNVSGSCTGFTEFDPRVYCYLSDGDLNRFIVPAVIGSNSDVSTLADIVEGNNLQLTDSGPVFRAEILLSQEDWLAKDGDHLAAIKSLVVSFSPRRSTGNDDVVISEYFAKVVRSFYMATVIGATSVRKVRFNLETAIPTQKERAQITLWALVMLCIIISILLFSATFFWFSIPRYIKWNIPVNFNGFMHMAKDESCIPDESLANGALSCGLVDDGHTVRFRPVAPHLEKREVDVETVADDDV